MTCASPKSLRLLRPSSLLSLPLLLLLCATLGTLLPLRCHALGCSDGGDGGCSPPVGAKWDHWDMASSTYTYCFRGCPVPWLLNNTKQLGLNPYSGVVGVDHYWTMQGMPCINGEPQEFAHQKALAASWKRAAPGIRYLTYRILSAVPYDMVIRNKMLSDPSYFVQWLHAPGDLHSPGNGSICYNYESACFNDPTRINSPAHNCSFEIRAAAYAWHKPEVQQWFLDSVIKPVLPWSDGVWLDGIGPDNGAYMCAGACCGYDGHNSPLVTVSVVVCVT